MTLVASLVARLWRAYWRLGGMKPPSIGVLLNQSIALIGMVCIGASLFGLDWAWISAQVGIQLSPPYDPFLTGIGLVVVAWLLHDL